MTLLGELKRRGVIRVGVAYLAAIWLVVQVAATVFPAFGLPAAALTILIIVLTVGLVPVTVLSWKFEWTAGGIRADTGETEDLVSARRQAQYLDRGITLLLVIGISYFALDKFVFDPARDATRIEAARQEGRADAIVDSYGDNSIIVLPFINMSSDPEQEYFSDGISEELLNLLAQIPELRVISRSTAFTYKGKDVVPQEIARKLNVAHVLEGSVRKSGNRLRITAQLIDARTDTHLWSETYDRELDDVFAIQDEISARVIADLKVEIFGALPAAQQVDGHVYEAYLRARSILQGLRVAQYGEAERLLNVVLQTAPDYLPALWEMARLQERYRYLAQENAAAPERQAVDANYKSKILVLVERMTEIAADSSQTNLWRAYIAWEWKGALQEAAGYFERALAAPSSNYDAAFQVSRFLFDLGRHDEAVLLAMYVVDRDPACSLCVTLLVRSLRALGHHREAAQHIESIAAWIEPNENTYWQLGAAWLVAGEAEKALAYFDKTGRPQGENLGRALALHDLGRQSEFEAEFQSMLQAPVPPREPIARVYAWTGQNDLAFEWLERMVEQAGPQSIRLVKTDLYSRLMADPRWQQFLQKYGQEDAPPPEVVFNPPYPEEVRRALQERQMPAASTAGTI